MKLVIGVLAASLCFAVGSNSPAQKPDPTVDKNKTQKKPDDQVTIRGLVVRLPITVKKENKFVPGLSKSNFEVYEDGKRQTIEDFMAPSQLPLYVAVLMDTSNSVKLKLPVEKDAAEDFVSSVTTYRRRDLVLFATFDSSIELHQDFTDAQEKLIGAIRKVKAGGFTRLYDAVHRVIEEKLANVQSRDARRIIVVLSDGDDTASEFKLKQAIEMAQRYDVTIFGISTKNFSGVGVGAGTVEGEEDKELRTLCEATGGQVFLPSQKIELYRAFKQVAEDLRQEYVVFYTPTNQERTGKPREIKVKLLRGEGHLFHKRGYTYP
jgi:Ca-activated chloride channel homolog